MGWSGLAGNDAVDSHGQDGGPGAALSIGHRACMLGEAPKQTIIAHRKLSWEPPGQPRPVTLRGLPAVPVLSGLPVIGKAYAKNRNLLIPVRPSIVAEPGA